MKEMVYNDKFDEIILEKGLYEKFEYLIISYGIHPCAYLVIPKDEMIRLDVYEEDFYNFIGVIDGILNVHGGITYAKFGLRDLINQDNFVLGWDYAHLGDYTYGIPLDSDKKWTTFEILKEVENVIDQLVVYKSKVKKRG